MKGDMVGWLEDIFYNQYRYTSWIHIPVPYCEGIAGLFFVGKQNMFSNHNTVIQ